MFVYRHFDDMNLFGCPGMQFADTYTFCRRLCIYSLRFWAFLFLIPLVPVGLVSMLLLTVFGCVIGPCTQLFEDVEGSGWYTAWLLLCTWPILLCLGVAMCCISIVTVACLGFCAALICKCAPYAKFLSEKEVEEVLIWFGGWPFVPVAIVLLVGSAVLLLGSLPLIIPVSLWYHCKPRPPLDQDDHNMG